MTGDSPLSLTLSLKGRGDNSFAKQTDNSLPSYHPTLISSKRIAFTLAEVLITLAIIGVVAALTMPPLISNHRKHIVETKLKRFYSTMNQAIQLSEIDNGDKMSWNFHYDMGGYDENTLTLFFNTYLKNYIKTTKTEYKNRGFFIYFADGSVAALGYYGNDINYFIEPKYVGSSQQGKSSFLFGFYPAIGTWANLRYNNFHGKGVEPYISSDWNGTREGLKLRSENYTKLIQFNGWKIPDDYPIKF